MCFSFTSKENFKFVTPRYGHQDYFEEAGSTKKEGWVYALHSVLKMEKNVCYCLKGQFHLPL